MRLSRVLEYSYSEQTSEEGFERAGYEIWYAD
jgi:hypothetical protein